MAVGFQERPFGRTPIVCICMNSIFLLVCVGLSDTLSDLGVWLSCSTDMIWASGP